VSLGIVDKEEVLVLGVGLNPVTKLRLSNQRVVRRRAVVARLLAEEQLLEVGVVEDVWVLAPPG